MAGLSNEELEMQWKQALVGHECALCIKEIDSLKKDLIVLDQFAKEDMKMATWYSNRLANNALIDYSLPINPYLEDTRVIIHSFLFDYYDEESPDDITAVKQALINLALDGKTDKLISILDQEIGRINSIGKKSN